MPACLLLLLLLLQDRAQAGFMGCLLLARLQEMLARPFSPARQVVALLLPDRGASTLLLPDKGASTLHLMQKDSGCSIHHQGC